MNCILNITDCTSMKDPNYSKIVLEIEWILSRKISMGQLDTNKEHTLFVCSRFGAATVTIIPKVNFQ